MLSVTEAFQPPGRDGLTKQPLTFSSSPKHSAASIIAQFLRHELSSTFQADLLCLLLCLLPGMPDGTLDTVCAEETGSEEDLYEELHNSGHHYSHPRGGGEQLAINEVV